MDRIASAPPNFSEAQNYEHIPTMTSPTFGGLEAMLPSYWLFAIKIINNFFGFDIVGWVLPLAVYLVAILSGISYVWRRTQYYILNYCVSSITIESDDELYHCIMRWLEGKVSSRTLQAKSAKGTDQTINDPERVSDYQQASKDGGFHLTEWRKSSKPRYQPSFGTHFFWFQDRFFCISRQQHKVTEQGGPGYEPTVEKVETFQISCAGYSTTPIKNFIQETKGQYLDQEYSKTIIFRPKLSGWGGRWARANTRASRPINTVIFDEVQKQRLLDDVSDFLHPETPLEYAKFGIPYRRGYLFHGPPGTGKSSLTFALGGLHGLGIYCLSLVDLSEDKLLTCFGDLPERCIVLIEDIDTVEISQRRDEEDGTAKDGEGVTSVTQTTRFRGRDSNRGQQQQITLSGLLNAIDGVAAHEGRILIMTTNHPEKLDAALVRKGRVDLEIEFQLATQEQIVKLFLIMYSRDFRNGADISEIDEKLKVAAHIFAGILPAGKLSPAQVQGYLLERRKSYSKALEEAAEWRDQTLGIDQGK